MIIDRRDSFAEDEVTKFVPMR